MHAVSQNVTLACVRAARPFITSEIAQLVHSALRMLARGLACPVREHGDTLLNRILPDCICKMVVRGSKTVIIVFVVTALSEVTFPKNLQYLRTQLQPISIMVTNTNSTNLNYDFKSAR